MEHNALALSEIKHLYEVGWTDNPKYYPYHQLISHPIEGCFILKGNIQNLNDSGTLSVLVDSIKPTVHQVSITEDTLEEDEYQVPDDKETPNLGEEWMVSERKGAKYVESMPTQLKRMN